MNTNFKSLLIENHIHANDIKKGLYLVKEYAAKSNMILYGGLAIDYALRVKGEKLYSDDEIPDYDFYSDKHYQDAINLGRILYDNGLQNISVINALHVQTMKVRVNFTAVADITYIPTSIFKSIETFGFNDMKVVHPYFQYIDLHLRISMPLRNFPMEVINERGDKDFIRYVKLLEKYPINPRIRESELIDKKVTIKGSIDDYVIQGIVAFALLEEYVKPKNRLTKIKGNVIEYKSAKKTDMQLVLLGKKPKNYTAKFKPYLNKLPFSYKSGDVLFIDFSGDLMMYFKTGGYKIVNTQFLLFYFMLEYYRSDKNEIYILYYKRILDMIPKENAKISGESPFKINVNFNGDKSMNTAFERIRVMELERLGKKIEESDKYYLDPVPRHYYVHSGNRNKPMTFDYESSELYKETGEKIE